MSPTDSGFVIDMTDPNQAALFRYVQAKYALKIEVETGMRHSKGSVLAKVNRACGTNFRRKQQAIDFLDVKIKEITDKIVEDPA